MRVPVQQAETIIDLFSMCHDFNKGEITKGMHTLIELVYMQHPKLFSKATKNWWILEKFKLDPW